MLTILGLKAVLTIGCLIVSDYFEKMPITRVLVRQAQSVYSPSHHNILPLGLRNYQSQLLY